MRSLLIYSVIFFSIACNSKSTKGERSEALDTNTVENDITTIKGKVFNQVDSTAINGAIVFIPGSTTGTISNVDGDFMIKMSTDNHTLVFASEGFVTSKVPMILDSVNYIYLLPKTDQ